MANMFSIEACPRQNTLSRKQFKPMIPLVFIRRYCLHTCCSPYASAGQLSRLPGLFVLIMCVCINTLCLCIMYEYFVFIIWTRLIDMMTQVFSFVLTLYDYHQRDISRQYFQRIGSICLRTSFPRPTSTVFKLFRRIMLKNEICISQF